MRGKKRDASRRKSTKTEMRGKNTDARQRREAKTQTRGIATSHYRKLIGAKESLFMILSYSQDILKAKMFKDIRLFLNL